MPSRILVTSALSVVTAMPSATTVAHAGCGFGNLSMCTRHMRQTATGSILGCAQ